MKITYSIGILTMVRIRNSSLQNDPEIKQILLDEEELNLFSLPKQEPCGSHTLNLIPSHDISKAIEPNNPKRKKPTNKPSIYSKVLFF